jgi:2',3'-cyclic-nucleotide 2'-phosphodiesterase (5'-nucleotidase family)
MDARDHSAISGPARRRLPPRKTAWQHPGMHGYGRPLGIALALCCACGGRPPPASPRTDSCRAVTLSIVATNDVHGQLERLPIVAGFVDNLRAAAPDRGILLVDAGDAFQGTIESNMNEGAAVVSAFRTMGYSAFALGNHEFDFGPEGPANRPLKPGDDTHGALERRIAEAPFAMLSANLADSSGRPPPWPHLAASTEVTVNGIRIGIVGLLTENAKEVIKRPNFDGLTSLPMVPIAEREAERLRKAGADVILVVAHEGGECARFDDPDDLSSCAPDSEIFRFARAMPKGLVDVIVGGHKNAGVAHVVAGIPIVHAPSNLLAFSRVDLVFDPAARRVIERRVKPPQPVCAVPMEEGCNPGAYEGRPVVADPAVRAAIQPALDAARDLRNRPLGVTVTAPFPVEKHGEMALGNLFADIMREAVPGSDVAIGNAGSVRDVLPAGELTFGQLRHVMPFDNELSRVAVTGAELARAMEASLADATHGTPAVSGIRVDASCEGGALKVTLQHPNGAPIRDDEHLVVATSDFLALGGDGLFEKLHLPADRVELSTGKTVIDALVTGITARHTLRPDDPALIDPKHPRIRLPEGGQPVHCQPAGPR